MFVLCSWGEGSPHHREHELSKCNFFNYYIKNSREGDRLAAMVYKVMGEFQKGNFTEKINKLLNKYKFIYKDGVLFLALQKYMPGKTKQETEQDCLRELRGIFVPETDFWVSQIDETNLSREEQSVRDWCRDRLVDLDRQRYEVERQEKLQATWMAMENMELILQAEIECRRKVGAGKKESKAPRKPSGGYDLKGKEG